MATKEKTKVVLSNKARKILLKAKAGESGQEIDYQTAGEIIRFLEAKDYLSDREKEILGDAREYIQRQQDVHMYLCDTGRFPSDEPKVSEVFVTELSEEAKAIYERVLNGKRFPETDNPAKDCRLAQEITSFLKGKGLDKLSEKERVVFGETAMAFIFIKMENFGFGEVPPS